MKRKSVVVVMAMLALFGGVGFSQPQAPPGGEGRFETFPGLEITAFATEPTLVKPTSLTVDERGRVWVLEGHNYRNNFLNNRKVAGDRVLILEDTDSDGKADKSTVFYQGVDVNAALGISIFGNKVIVASYENIFVFTNENDVPVRKDVMFTAQTGNSDHSTHAFAFGPDGKLYWNAGNSVSRVMDKDGRNIVDVRGKEVTAANYRQGRAFRVNEDGSGFEVLGYNFRNNFELAVDSYGSVWQTDNDDDGNQSTRVNFVMEGGNHGYQDEVTGAAWRTPRYDLETAIGDRHWHQNSPGVVPNVRVNGAGSPAGLAFYEGSLLPAQLRGQMIHAEPGWNSVRAYPLREQGAGFTADTTDIVSNVENSWFRPSDVAVAPDGSLFISDWADPGVGGHRQGDQTLGRIYRVAPTGSQYRPGRPDVSTVNGAIDALKSPSQSVRYLAWHRLNSLQAEAERPLRDLFEATNGEARFRARALWLLTKIEGRGDFWVRRGLSDRDVNIRITAMRAARQLKSSVLPYIDIARNDNSAQVRREAALALRGQSGPRAAELWAELAAKHTAGDRWAVEALGIGAQDRWDDYFSMWREKVGAKWNTPAGRDIVWRSRSEAAIPLLVELIKSPATTAAERPRYFRSLDFYPVARKQEVLRSLLDSDGNASVAGEVAALALFGLDVDVANPDPTIRTALDRALASTRGTRAFVDLVARFSLRDQASELVRMAMADPNGTLGQEAARLALNLVMPPPAPAARGGGAGRQGAAGGGPPGGGAPAQGGAANPAAPVGGPAPPNTPDPVQNVTPAAPAPGGPGGGRGGAAVPVDPAPVAVLFDSYLSNSDQNTVRKALQVLGTADHAGARQMLQRVALDSARSEPIRREAIRALGLTRGGETMLLALANEGVLPEDLKAPAALVLFSSYHSATRIAAAKVLQPPQAATGTGGSLRPPGELALRTGDAEAGQAVFRRVCVACHQIDGQGVAFGPDLSQIGAKFAKQALLSKIIDPNSGVAFGYETTVLKLKNGDTAAGYVVNDAQGQVALKAIGGISTTYAASAIESREVLATSMMPTGLTGAMSESDLINLVEYLSRRRSGGKPR